MLDEIAPEVWIADGAPVTFMGAFSYPTRMAIVRLSDGGLWVWSPIALDRDLAREVAALGPVRHLVSPNKIHHLFLGEWSARWPDAKIWASPGLASRRPDLSFAAELGDHAPAEWAGQLEQVVFRGSWAMEEVVFFHPATGTALFCDLIQKFDPATLSGWRGVLMRLDDLVGPNGSTPREWRLSFLRRGPARAALKTAIDWNPQRLVIAHGEWVRSDAKRVLARSLAWLRGT